MSDPKSAKYWLQPRWTASAHTRNWLYFDESQVQRGIARKMSVGDHVLLYLTATLGGSKTIVASFVISGELEDVPKHEPTIRGARDWRYRRAVNHVVAVPAESPKLGVPLSFVREVLGWHERATLRQAITIPRDKYSALENELRRRVAAAGL